MIQLYTLDTNTASYIIKKKSAKAKHRLESLSARETACISVITEAELRFGLAYNPLATAQRAYFEGFMNMVEVLPWDSREAQAYATLRAQQQALGKTIAPFDLLIAAHAFSVGATLVTKDKAFSHIPNLFTEDWATDV